MKAFLALVWLCSASLAAECDTSAKVCLACKDCTRCKACSVLKRTCSVCAKKQDESAVRAVLRRLFK